MAKGTGRIELCLFELCTADYGGAFDDFNGGLAVTFVECEIKKCSATSEGGGAISCGKIRTSSWTLSWVYISDCSAVSSSYGQAIHIYTATSFTWSNLCITGTGTLVMSEVSSITVPTASQLSEGCPKPFPTRSRSRSPTATASRKFTQHVINYSPRRRIYIAFMEYICHE